MILYGRRNFNEFQMVVYCKRMYESNASKTIHNLYNRNDNKLLSKQEKTDRINNALEIYQNIDKTKKNYSLLNGLLKLCFNFGEAQRFLIFYDDIAQLIKCNKGAHKLSYPLIIKSCIETHEIEKCMQVFSWLKHYKYSLQIHEKFITKLIHQCSNNVYYLRYISSLINENIIQCKSQTIIKTSLIYNFGKMSNITDAIAVFNSIKHTEKDIICILTILKVCNGNSDYYSTLKIYENMSEFAGIKNEILYHYYALFACNKIGDINKGKEIELLVELNLMNDKKNKVLFSCLLIALYGNYGHIARALEIFEAVSDLNDNECLHNILRVLFDNGCYDKLLHIYDEYNCNNHNFEADMFAIKTCAQIKDYERGKKIINNNKMYINANNIKYNNLLINFYGKCGDITNALNVFNNLIKSEMETSVSICNIMSVLLHNQYHKYTIRIYHKYHKDNNYIIDILAMKAFLNCNGLESAKRIENKLLLSSDNAEIMSRLIDLYAFYSDIKSAQNIFNNIKITNIAIKCCYNMMKLYMSVDKNVDALHIYDRFHKHNTHFSHILAIKICTKMSDFERGKKYIYHNIKRKNNIQLLNTLINFYANELNIAKALEIFNCIEENSKTIVTINAMMETYYLNEMYTECLDLFTKYSVKLKADAITYAILFEACANATKYAFGENIHHKLIEERDEIILNDIVVISNLINMYSKCGYLQICVDIFENSKYKNDILIYNAILNAYAKNGDFEPIQRLMLEILDNDTDLKANIKTYCIFINACSHCKNMAQAKDTWNNINDHKIKYDQTIISCLIDCLTRNDDINMATDLMIHYQQMRNNKMLKLE